ncbi:MAG: FAD-binding protein [Armatimonadota bacterium]|nr:FAD-binding protein [Armatimonadota bacterium]
MILKPQSAADVQDILHGSGSYCICGTGSKSMFGPPINADNTIDLSEMSGIVDWSPDDLVVTAKAGTTIAEIDTELASKGQMIGVPTFQSQLGKLTAGMPATLGGLISANLPTRWESICRGPRYWTLGLTMIRANRDLVKCGSRAVKNVAGYDVQKLIVGAWGTLGVITEVTLRTQPLKQFDDEPKSEWGGEPPFCIARTLPTGVDDYISANPIHDPIIDRGTGTIWARAIKPAAKPKNGWVINAGFGENDRSQLGENEDIMRAIKQKLDPSNRFNPGRMF